MANAGIPSEAKEADLVLKAGQFVGPGGIVFGRPKNAGLFNVGATPVDEFLKANPGLFAGISPSLPRVMRAVSANEGKLEAVNSYDNAFMSFGVFQWTAGADDAPGELADLLSRLQSTRPAAFTEYFGKSGLGVKIGLPRAGALNTGFIVLNGEVLDTNARKMELRKPIWGYRFWRAGHDTEVRACEIEQAMARIDVFYRNKSPLLGSMMVSDFVTSEYGVALLLDQHVNRPGHVPKTLSIAINAFPKKDPKAWTTDDERKVLASYLAERAKTSMTDSEKRAKSIKNSVDAGELSDERGSFL
jgi:hypothetical protein